MYLCMLQVMGEPENKNCYLLFLKQNKQRPLTPLELNLPSVFRTDSVLIQKKNINRLQACRQLNHSTSPFFNHCIWLIKGSEEDENNMQQ